MDGNAHTFRALAGVGGLLWCISAGPVRRPLRHRTRLSRQTWSGPGRCNGGACRDAGGAWRRSGFRRTGAAAPGVRARHVAAPLRRPCLGRRPRPGDLRAGLAHAGAAAQCRRLRRLAQAGRGAGLAAACAPLAAAARSPGRPPTRRQPHSASGIDLERALERLNPPQRLCVVLSYGEGLSHGEIADTTGWPLGTVKSHVARGGARLREWLGP